MPFVRFLRTIRHIVSENKIAAFIFTVTIFLRFVKLEQFTTFLGDQGRDAIIVKRLITFEHFPAIGPTMSVGQVFLGPFYYYLISPFLLLFNFNPVGLSVAIALLSVVGIALSYFIIKKEASIATALVFLWLVTFSSVNIEMARFSWNPNLLPIFSFITLYFFYRFLKKQTVLNSIIVGSLLSLSLQLHYLALFMFGTIGIIGLKELLLTKNKRLFLRGVLISVVSFIFFYSPLIIFDLRHQFLNSKGLLKLFSAKDVVGGGHSLASFLETNKNFFDHIFATNVNTYVALFLFLIIVVVAIKEKLYPKKLLLQIHTLNIVLYIYLFSLLTSFRYPHYYNTIYYSFFFMAAYFLTSLIKNKKITWALIAVLIGIFTYFNAQNYYFIFKTGSDQIGRARTVAKSIVDHNPQSPYQLTALPYTEIDGHVRYFLELMGKRPLSEESFEQPKELYVLCYYKECEVLNHPQWQIAFFKNKKIATIWEVLNIKIYKLIHEK